MIIRVLKSTEVKNEQGVSLSSSNPAEKIWKEWATANRFEVVNKPTCNFIEIRTSW